MREQQLQKIMLHIFILMWISDAKKLSATREKLNKGKDKKEKVSINDSTN